MIDKCPDWNGVIKMRVSFPYANFKCKYLG